MPQLGGLLTSLDGWLLHFANRETALQSAVVAAALVLAIALDTRFDRFLKRLAFATAPRDWVPGIARAVSPVTLALLLLLLLWSTLILANALGHDFPIVRAAASLAAAWIVIRVASRLVDSQTWSMMIAVTVWIIAALGIVGLLGAITHQLDASAISFGRFRLSALTAIRAVFALGVLLWLTMIASNFLERRINKTSELTPAIRAALIQILRLLLPILAVVAALSVVGIDLTALAVFSGAIGIGIGLGLQQTMANFVAGLSLVLGKTIEPGDVIGYGKGFGWVTQMGARYVSIRTRDGVAHHIPNSYFVVNGVENWSHFGGPVRLHVAVSVGYDADLPQAIGLCLEAAREEKRVLSRPEPICLVAQFGDSAIHLDLRIWINDPPQGVTNVKSGVMVGIWKRFHEAGIRFPYPQRDVHVVPPADDGIARENLPPRREIFHS